MIDGRTDGQKDRQTDRITTPNFPRHSGTVSLHFTRASVFMIIRWKQICGNPFILKSHNITDTTNQNAYLKLNQV